MIEHTIARFALRAGGLYLCLNLFALFFSELLIFVPRDPGYKHLPNEVRIPVANGESINAVYLEHPGAPHTILFSHGNAEDIEHVVPFMRQFHDLGYSVLMYDYRGYGTSDGRPSVRNAKADVSAAYRWLVEKKKVDPKTIIAQGRSLGGAFAVWLATRHEVGGLIVESSFVSAFRVKTHWPLLPWDKLNSLAIIGNVDCPVLVMHGTEDEVVPFWHGKKLYAAAPEPKLNLWIEGGMHNDYAYVAEDDYLRVCQELIALVARQENSRSTRTPK
jgi:fermentation-respiration switch protein FrsA (DUF1100 family)